MKRDDYFKVYCDGSGFNNINSAYCIIVSGWKKKRINGKNVFKNKKEVKVIWDNKNVYQIEYIALIGALKLCERISKKNIKFNIYSDSMCVVEEVNFRKKPKNRKLFKEARKLMDKNSNINVNWIPRTENLAGIYLEDRLMKLHRYGRKGRGYKN